MPTVAEPLKERDLLMYQEEYDTAARPARPRGFAAMDKERQREIARLGGRAAHAQGTAHEFTSEEARDAGRRGGDRVSRDREHMAAIGRRGGEAVSRDREQMAERGRAGGLRRAARYAARRNGNGAHPDGAAAGDGLVAPDADGTRS
jgi:general stress protein YciG